MNEKKEIKKGGRMSICVCVCVCTWVMESPKRRKLSNEVYATIGFD